MFSQLSLLLLVHIQFLCEQRSAHVNLKKHALYKLSLLCKFLLLLQPVELYECQTQHCEDPKMSDSSE